jgi:hypothetical protein
MSRKNHKQIKDKSPGRTGAKNARATSGQALIEFVLGLMIVIAFFFFYVKMAAVFAVGNFIHYATFMAARAYSSSAETPDAQQRNAEAVIQKMLAGKWKPLLKPTGGGTIPGATVGPGPYFNDDPGADNWNQGVVYSYETKMSLYPWSRGNGAITMKLASESWIRREETESEARETLDKKIQAKITLPGVKVEWDNGY